MYDPATAKPRRHLSGRPIFQSAFGPRGDAASLLFGFNAEGKITGIGIMSMAGD
ncbi:MAG: hypothetical protein ACREDM_07200 [Methylocella sp.]